MFNFEFGDLRDNSVFSDLSASPKESNPSFNRLINFLILEISFLVLVFDTEP